MNAASIARAIAPTSATTSVRLRRVVTARARPQSNENDEEKATLMNLVTSTAISLSITLCAPSASMAKTTVFAGNYYDPNHPGCPRSIDAKGVVRGLDPVPFKRGKGCRGVKKDNVEKTEAKFKPWKVPGNINRTDDEIVIDFNAKDGSGEKLAGKWDANGIKFPDGTKWKKLSDADAWTPR